jgi:hypothetical protein
MICPICRSDSEMAYSSFLSGFICLGPTCGFELEMEDRDAAELVLSPEEELVLA